MNTTQDENNGCYFCLNVNYENTGHHYKHVQRDILIKTKCITSTIAKISFLTATALIMYHRNDLGDPERLKWLHVFSVSLCCVKMLKLHLWALCCWLSIHTYKHACSQTPCIHRPSKHIHLIPKPPPTSEHNVITLTIWMPRESSSGLLRSLKAKRSVLSQSMEILWRYWSANVSQTCRESNNPHWETRTNI